MSINNRNCGSQSKNPLAACFFSLPPEQFALLSSILGILLIDDLDLNQQNQLGNFIVNIGQAILTAAAQGQALESNSSPEDQLRMQVQMLKKQICSLEQELDNIK